jgi:hypothetical protein
MRIDPNNEPAAAPRIRARLRGRGLEPDKGALNGSEALAWAWQETPEVRPEKVSRAKALLKHGSYPPAEVVAHIAFLMAERW